MPCQKSCQIRFEKGGQCLEVLQEVPAGNKGGQKGKAYGDGSAEEGGVWEPSPKLLMSLFLLLLIGSQMFTRFLFWFLVQLKLISQEGQEVKTKKPQVGDGTRLSQKFG